VKEDVGSEYFGRTGGKGNGLERTYSTQHQPHVVAPYPSRQAYLAGEAEDEERGGDAEERADCGGCSRAQVGDLAGFRTC
jgi:hypothetical protein